MGKSIWDIVAPIAGAALGSVVPGLGTGIGAALGGGLGSGLSKGVETGNPLAGLTSGVIGAAGSYAGSQLLGPTLGNIGSTTSAASGGTTAGLMGAPVAKSLGDSALSGVGSLFGSSTPGELAGGAIGSGVAQSAFDPTKMGIVGGPSTGAPPFSPSRSGDMALPGSLSGYAGLDPNQQASNIATRGVYGQGNGPTDNQYFLNLINRQLVDPSGNVAGDTSSVSPVEGQYLNQIGLGGYSSPNDLLQKISNYAA